MSFSLKPKRTLLDDLWKERRFKVQKNLVIRPNFFFFQKKKR